MEEDAEGHERGGESLSNSGGEAGLTDSAVFGIGIHENGRGGDVRRKSAGILLVLIMVMAWTCRKPRASWNWMEGTDRTVSFCDLEPEGRAIFIGYAGWKVSVRMSRKWVHGLVSQSPYRRVFKRIFAVPGPKDPPYERRFIKNDVLAFSTDVDRAEIVYVAAHSSGTYVADEFLDYAPDRVLEKTLLVILDGGEISAAHRAKVRHRFVSALKNLNAPRLVDGGRTLTLESWNYRLYRSFYGPAFLTLNADASACLTEHEIHDYVINPRSGEKGITPYNGPEYNVAAAFPEDFSTILRAMLKPVSSP
jgi:hypothetical protein